MAKATWFAGLGIILVAMSGTTHAQWKPETGLVLVGKVVTMNDAGDVLANARVWIADGMIRAIAKGQHLIIRLQLF